MIFDEIIFHTFRHTAQDSDNQISAFVLLHGMEKLQAVQNFLFRIITNGTSVHKHSVRFIQRFAYLITRHLHDRGNHFTVSHIHLASVGFDKQFLVFGFSCRFKVRSCCFFHISLFYSFMAKIRTSRQMKRIKSVEIVGGERSSAAGTFAQRYKITSCR